MSREKDLEKLLKSMKPKHNIGNYVFCEIENLENINLIKIQMTFRQEDERIAIIPKKEMADKLNIIPFVYIN